MKIRTGDTVKVLSGIHKGKTAKVAGVLPGQNAVRLEGIGQRKRQVKPNTLNPQGSTKEIHVAIHASNVAPVNPGDASKAARVGYEVKKDGGKVRVARNAANKEIK